MTNNQPGENGLEIDEGLMQTINELEEEVNVKDEDTWKSPEAVRRGAKAHAEELDSQKLLNQGQEVKEGFKRNVKQQTNVSRGLEEARDRGRNVAANQNLETHLFAANAEKTGQAGVEDEWELNATDYLEEDGELIEFAEEGDSLQQYSQRVSGEVQNQSETVQTATTIMGERSDEIESTVSDYDEKIESAEEDLEEAINDAETDFEEDLKDAREEKESDMEDIKDQIINQTGSDIEDSSYESQAEMSAEESREVQEDFRETKNALEEEKEQKIEEAEAEYDSTVEKLEQERAEELEDLRDEKEGWKNTKQEALQTRANALDEVEGVHADFSEDVVDYVQERAEEIDRFTRTLGILEQMAGTYNEEGIANQEDLDGEFDLGQRGLIEDVEDGAASIASRALEEIDYLEEAVEDYADVTGAMPDLLDEMDDRAGARMGEVTDLYDQLGVDVDEDVEDEYGIESLRNRVKEQVQNATGNEYDTLDTFKRQIRAEAENPAS